MRRPASLRSFRSGPDWLAGRGCIRSVACHVARVWLWPFVLCSESCTEAICLSTLHLTSLRPIMFQQLDYQECYRKVAHESVINAMVLSPDGRRLITGSGDSTVLMWSTQSGSALCRIKAHSPVLSLAWLKNSNGFLFGCENGTLASVDISEVLNMCSEPFTPHSC
jgi:WD40 repeat protein